MRLQDCVDNEYSTLGQLAKAFDRARLPETKKAILGRIYYSAPQIEEVAQRHRARDLSQRLDPVMLRAVDSLYPWHMRVVRRVQRWWAK